MLLHLEPKLTLAFCYSKKSLFFLPWRMLNCCCSKQGIVSKGTFFIFTGCWSSLCLKQNLQSTFSKELSWKSSGEIFENLLLVIIMLCVGPVKHVVSTIRTNMSYLRLRILVGKIFMPFIYFSLPVSTHPIKRFISTYNIFFRIFGICFSSERSAKYACQKVEEIGA